jgi:hypothetical protein
MKFPGLMMLGAQSRLLPLSVPFAFFLAAVVFHVFLWGWIAVHAEQVAGFQGGLGPVAAALHVLTLGVLVMTVMGASIQILPVATGQPLRAVWPCRLIFWLYLPGLVMFLHGLGSGEQTPMALGGGAVAAALLIYGLLVGDLLARARGMRLFALHAWAAVAALVLLASLGFLLVIDVEYAVLPDRTGVALAHVILAVYGFMGMTALGYSHILMPMFAMSEATPERLGFAVFGLAVAALVLSVVGAFVEESEVLVIGTAVALVAVVLHVWSMDRTLRGGMRKHLGVSFVLVRAGWACLPISIAVGGLAVAEIGEDVAVPLFGLFALFGWLLTFVLGILQRIIPFLAAMHASKEGQAPPLLSELAAEGPLKVHAVCHIGALALIGLGFVLEDDRFVTAGALIGAVGALIFLWFVVDVIRRTFRYAKQAS